MFPLFQWIDLSSSLSLLHPHPSSDFMGILPFKIIFNIGCFCSAHSSFCLSYILSLSLTPPFLSLTHLLLSPHLCSHSSSLSCPLSFSFLLSFCLFPPPPLSFFLSPSIILSPCLSPCLYPSLSPSPPHVHPLLSLSPSHPCVPFLLSL